MHGITLKITVDQNEQHDDYISRGYVEHFQKWAEEDLKTVMHSS